MIRALLTTAVLAFASSVATADTITVCLDGSCDYTDIQEAINAASDGDVIEIAAGTYYPAATIDTLDKAVTLRGVPGKGKDDAPRTVIDGQDSIRVLTCRRGEGAGTVFENLLITGGFVEGDYPGNSGGGMRNYYSSPTLSGCSFMNNSASFGGGMANEYSSPTLIGCAFEGNTATINGGGMYNRDSSSPTLTNCTFAGNSTNSKGGGMANQSSSPTLKNCTFEGNSANDGGGMTNYWNSSPTLTDCRFEENSAGGDGGGMENREGGNPTLTNCAFAGNWAVYGGGGCMYNFEFSRPTLTDCTFTECCQVVPPNLFIDNGGNDFAGNIYVACDKCRADVDCNDEVNAGDLGLLLSAWNTTEAQYDIDGDGVVGGGDLGMLLGSWGVCP